MKTTEKILVVDLEATCWENDGEYQRLHSEIIEIGICELDVRSGELSKNKGILVIPERSTISPFCTELTSITPKMIEEDGIPFADAVEILEKEYQSSHYTWASYGAYDRNKFQEQCREHGVDYPFGNQHINVKEAFRAASGLRRSVGMKRALKHLKMPLNGTHHRGVDDAYNIANILYWCIQNT
ncbi:exonuclease domain-containing protein [Aureisphaera galaxeae]|uniref:3'-5' exonuclease n=1 Tax=Aureisphaera galaxeae TaxID=1538023 RepID=UPI0023501FEC|nr:3'-5' exonuclease [Aureisphaera galaxeae]MDC8002909.1 exonuclease domain-containing protein [Aureisphaera galaxeae]